MSSNDADASPCTPPRRRAERPPADGTTVVQQQDDETVVARSIAAATLTSPVAFAKRLRAAAGVLWIQLAPLEAAARKGIVELEEMERQFVLTSSRLRVRAISQLEEAEDMQRCVILFQERSARRLFRRSDPHAMQQRRASSFAAAGDESPEVLAALTPGGFGGGNASINHSDTASTVGDGGGGPVGTSHSSRRRSTRHRVTKATHAAAAAEARRFADAVQLIDAEEVRTRLKIETSQRAYRQWYLERLFFDEHFETRMHLYDNVPRLSQETRDARARCAIMTNEARERQRISEERRESFRDLTSLVTPFRSAIILSIAWKDIQKQYLEEHYHYLENDLALHEGFEREQLEVRFQQERSRTFAAVGAEVAILEPKGRRQISAEQRRYRAYLTSTKHPRILQLARQAFLWRVRYYFQKLQRLPSRKILSANQAQLTSQRARAVHRSLLDRYLALWRHFALDRRQQAAAVALHKQNFTEWGGKFLNRWAAHVTRKTTLRNRYLRLAGRHDVHLRAWLSSTLKKWILFARERRAVALLAQNNQSLMRVAVRQWYWGAWKMRRQKQYRVKGFKLERMAQDWRVVSKLHTWLAFVQEQRLIKRKHYAVLDMAQRSALLQLRDRWRVLKLFAKRQRQNRQAAKLRRVNHNYHRRDRLRVWVHLVHLFHSTRTINKLLIKMIPQWLAEPWRKWNLYRGRRKLATAAILQQRTDVATQRTLFANWRKWAFRSQYRRKVVEDGPLFLLEGRNRMRYKLQRFYDWESVVALRRRSLVAEQLASTNEGRKLRNLFHFWQRASHRTVQLRMLHQIRKEGEAALQRVAMEQWKRHRAAQLKSKDLQGLAQSLELRSRFLFRQRIMRRWHTRAVAFNRLNTNRLALLLARQVRSLQQRYLDVWKQYRVAQQNARTAEHLEWINRDRRGRRWFSQWRWNAKTLRRERLAEALCVTNTKRREQDVWRRSWLPLMVRVWQTKELTMMREAAERRMRTTVLRRWVSYFHSWKKNLLAESLELKNRTLLLQSCYGPWAKRTSDRREARVVAHMLRTILVQRGALLPVAGKKKPSPPPQKTAAVRYWLRWWQFLLRQRKRQQAVGTLELLYPFWVLKPKWNRWLQTLRRYEELGDEACRRDHETTGGGNSLPPAVQSRRQLLRSLRLPPSTLLDTEEL